MSEFYGKTDDAGVYRHHQPGDCRSWASTFSTRRNRLRAVKNRGAGTGARIKGKTRQGGAGDKFRKSPGREADFLGVSGKRTRAPGLATLREAAGRRSHRPSTTSTGVDPEVPIGRRVGALRELVKAGKVRLLGMSEAATGAGPGRRNKGHFHNGAADRVFPLEDRGVEAGS